MSLKLKISDSIANINAASWDALVGNVPLLSHAFLSALETSGSVGVETGWQASPIFVFDDDVLVGAMPLYIKSHSYGEYRMLCRIL